MPTVSSKLFSSKKERVFFHYIVICLCVLVSVVKINLKSTLQKKHPYGKETALLKKKRKEISPDLKVFVKSYTKHSIQYNSRLITLSNVGMYCLHTLFHRIKF